MYERALAGKERALGADHPETLGTVGNLANVLMDQGKLDEAKAMYERALARYERALGADHPDTLAAVGNLALVLKKQGKLDEAKAMYERARGRSGRSARTTPTRWRPSTTWRSSSCSRASSTRRRRCTSGRSRARSGRSARTTPARWRPSQPGDRPRSAGQARRGRRCYERVLALRARAARTTPKRCARASARWRASDAVGTSRRRTWGRRSTTDALKGSDRQASTCRHPGHRSAARARGHSESRRVGQRNCAT